MIRNLIFDFGKVLVNYDFDAFLHSIFGDSPDFDAINEMLCGADMVDRCDKGDMAFPDIIHELQQRYPQWHHELQIFMDRQSDAITSEVDGMRELILRYKSQGYHVYGLTNWSNTVYAVINKFDILQLMEGTVISSEEKIIKPDVAIYECLLKRYGLKADECVFTDDKLRNIEGARAAGMHAILFHDAHQYEQELKKLI